MVVQRVSGNLTKVSGCLVSCTHCFVAVAVVSSFGLVSLCSQTGRWLSILGPRNHREAIAVVCILPHLFLESLQPCSLSGVIADKENGTLPGCFIILLLLTIESRDSNVRVSSATSANSTSDVCTTAGCKARSAWWTRSRYASTSSNGSKARCSAVDSKNGAMRQVVPMLAYSCHRYRSPS